MAGRQNVSGLRHKPVRRTGGEDPVGHRHYTEGVGWPIGRRQCCSPLVSLRRRLTQVGGAEKSLRREMGKERRVAAGAVGRKQQIQKMHRLRRGIGLRPGGGGEGGIGLRSGKEVRSCVA